MRSDTADELRILLSFFLSVVVFTILLVVPLPGNEVSYIQDPSLHLDVRRGLYWGSGIVTFLFLIQKTGTNNMMGSLVAILFGPLVPMTMGAYWLSLKAFPRKIA